MLANLFSIFSSFFHFILGIGSTQNFPPPLTSEEEHEYFVRAEQGDSDARRELIVHNLRLVSHIVRKYYASSKNQEDLVSIGTIGLIKAVDTFKVSAGARFATYASRCIQNEILMHFRAGKKLSAEISLSDTIDVDRDGNPLTYLDVISCDDSMPDDVERKISSARAKKCVDTVLTSRERKIIILRYGLDGVKPLSQREVSEKLGISRSYVSRLEKTALEKLRDAMS